MTEPVLNKYEIVFDDGDVIHIEDTDIYSATKCAQATKEVEQLYETGELKLKNRIVKSFQV